MNRLNKSFNLVASCDVGASYCIVASSAKKNGVFLVDKRTMTITLLGEIEKCEGKKLKISYETHYKDFVLFVPCLDPDIHFFIQVNLRENKINYIDISCAELNFNYAYCAAFREKEKVWFFPNKIKETLVIYNIFSNEYEVVKEWNSIFDFLEVDEYYYPGAGTPVCVDGKLYLTVTTLNYIVEIDIDTKGMVLHEISKDYELAFPMVYDGETFLILQAHNKGLLYWHPKIGVIKNIPLTAYNNPLCEETKCHAWFRNIWLGKRYIWLSMAQDKRLTRIEKSTGKQELFNVTSKIPVYEKENPFARGAYMVLSAQENEISLCFGASKEIVSLDLQQDEVKEEKPSIDFSSIPKKELFRYLGKEMLFKGDNLNILIDYLVYVEDEEK